MEAGSKRELRRIWPHNIESNVLFTNKEGVSIDVIQYDFCAICRGELKVPCINCQANCSEFMPENPKNEFRRRAKEIWQTLLLCHKREPLSALPMDVLHVIFKHANPSYVYQHLNLCPVTRVYCDHLYHACCFTKWLGKRECCPLCNVFFPRDGVLELFSCEEMFRCEVGSSRVTSEDFIRKKDWHDRVDIANRNVIRTLKSHPNSPMSQEELYIAYKSFITSFKWENQQIPEHRFIEVLQGLVEQEFIFRDADGKFHYLA